MPGKLSEKYDQRLIETIVHMHNMGVGYRRMTKELEAQGFPRLSKDTLRRLYLQAASKDLPEETEDSEIRRLRKSEKEKVERSRLAKEKLAIWTRIKDLEIEDIALQFGKKKKIFRDEKAALKFLCKVMPVIDALLWDQFLEFCAKRNYRLSNAALLALGKIEDFEEMLRTDRKSVDQYLADRLKSSIQKWQEERKNTEECEEETLQASDDPDEYVDDEGFWHITIRSNDDYE